MPVGTFSAPDANRVAQIQRGQDSGGSNTGVAAPGRRAAGVTVANESTRGDLDQTAPPVAITVRHSTDLNALAQAVALASFGEPIVVEDSVFTRPGGGINADAGEIHARTLTFTRTTLAADVIKARSYQTGGRDALVVDGSRFDAARLVRLYAGGAGTLRFRGDVTLNAPQVDLAGSSVVIDPGSRVSSTGKVSVFADVHGYDQPGTGVLEATVKERRTHAERPRF
ncbi:MAG: hypothetical protein ACKV19_01330 [Verrucomicrobiales bacterium]